MTRRRDRDEVLAAFAAALAGDPAAPQLLGWTRLGHVELTRRRGRPPLLEILCRRRTEGGWLKSAETIALEALRLAAREAALRPPRAPTLVVHPEVAAALSTITATARRAFEAALARPLAIIADPTLRREAFDFRAE
jgi:Ribonuclease G/E